MPVLSGVELPIGVDFDVVYGELVKGKGAHDLRDGTILSSMTVSFILEQANGTDLATGTCEHVERGKYRGTISGADTAAVAAGDKDDDTTWVLLKISTTNPVDYRELWLLPVKRGKN